MVTKIVYIKNYLLIFLIFELIFSGCANKETIKDNLNLSAEVKNFNAWLNLMPSISKLHSIHIKCELIINDFGETDIKQLKLKGIKVLQNDNEINFKNYSLIPMDTISSQFDNKKKYFITGVTLINETAKINYNMPSKFLFFYSSSNKSYIDTVYNVIIGKVY